MKWAMEHIGSDIMAHSSQSSDLIDTINNLCKIMMANPEKFCQRKLEVGKFKGIGTIHNQMFIKNHPLKINSIFDSVMEGLCYKVIDQFIKTNTVNQTGNSLRPMK